MNKQTMLWIICFIVLVAPFISHSQVDSKNVEGMVINKDNIPQNRVQVRFEGPMTYISLTNYDGKYFLSEVRNGMYTVTVTRGTRFQKFKVRVINNRIEPKILTVNW